MACHRERAEIDRTAEEAAGTFGERIATAGCRGRHRSHLLPAGERAAARRSLTRTGRPFLHCGTIWVHGPSVEVPTTEAAPRTAFGDYGLRKAAIEAWLLSQASDFPVTILHPGHLVGPGWAPINPAGNFNPAVFSQLRQGKPIQLPNIGMETVHHVHADDVAQCFVKAMEQRSAALGRGLPRGVARGPNACEDTPSASSAWFGHPAQLQFLPWEEWRQRVTRERCSGDLGSHRPLAKLQHRQSTHSPGIRTALQLARSGARVTRLAHRARIGLTAVIA